MRHTVLSIQEISTKDLIPLVLECIKKYNSIFKTTSITNDLLFYDFNVDFTIIDYPILRRYLSQKVKGITFKLKDLGIIKRYRIKCWKIVNPIPNPEDIIKNYKKFNGDSI